ncbi:GumN family protein (fragment) [uncultured Paludibacter sp.]
MTNMQAMQMKLMQGSIMNDTTCKDLMTEDDYRLVDNEFKQLLGAGLDQLGKMKPMMLNTLYVGINYLKINNLTKQPEAVDVIFQKAALENNKKTLALETLDQQIDIIFNSIPLKRQAEILVKSIKEKNKGVEELKKLNILYLAGDLVEAEKLNREDDNMTPEERDILITNRNNNWMRQIPELIKSQQSFIAVGFLHLAGETGLINQLKTAGYNVESVDL